VSQAGGFASDSFEDVVDKRVHDRHGFAGHAGVGVDLLQHFIDVNGVGLLTLLVPLLLVSLGDVLGRLTGFFDGFSTCLRRHGLVTRIFQFDKMFEQL
jgi:hypothetical protein